MKGAERERRRRGDARGREKADGAEAAEVAEAEGAEGC